MLRIRISTSLNGLDVEGIDIEGIEGIEILKVS